MMLGIVLISMLVGGTAAISALWTSGSVMLSLVVFMSTGSLAVFLLAALIVFGDFVGRKLATVSGRAIGVWTPQGAANQKI